MPNRAKRIGIELTIPIKWVISNINMKQKPEGKADNYVDVYSH